MHWFHFHGIRHLSLCTSWGKSLNHSSKEMYEFPQMSQKPNIHGFKKNSCTSPTHSGRNQAKLSEKENEIDFLTSICHIQNRQAANSSFYYHKKTYMIQVRIKKKSMFYKLLILKRSTVKLWLILRSTVKLWLIFNLLSLTMMLQLN